VVELRRGDLDSDSPPDQLTTTYEVWLEKNDFRLGTTENGRRIERGLIRTFYPNKDEMELIDFIVMADRYIFPVLTGDV
jgi:hypothetical protein